ncbi:MAG: DarT ssDNA thymidine ADP-ribosyltransferase family protein [Anaerolineales bacterium]|nr:DarT ssDNA thymidine ADP-ribosyltransferase family protein [Anaerolineales bacterium]
MDYNIRITSWWFAEYWTHLNPFREFQHKSIKCAEVLVPQRVAPDHIFGAYVSNPDTRTVVETHAQQARHPLEVIIDRHLFFLGDQP